MGNLPVLAVFASFCVGFGVYWNRKGRVKTNETLMIGVCGHKVREPGAVDEITMLRLIKVRKIFDHHFDDLKQKVFVTLTGNRGVGSIGLAMRQHMALNSVPEENLFTTRGVGTFQEGRTVFETARIMNASKVIMVTSDWHARAATPFWKYLSYRSGISLEVERVWTGPISDRMQRDYASFKLMMQLVLIPAYLGIEFPLRLLERRVAVMEERRAALGQAYDPENWRKQLR